MVIVEVTTGENAVAVVFFVGTEGCVVGEVGIGDDMV